jgi:hypothetical protein
MCISNDQIRRILAVQRKRFLARVRYHLKQKDPWGKPVTQELAESYSRNPYGDISYEESLKKDEYPYCGKGGFWRSCKRDIVRQRCPIPYVPEMPLTRCLECTAKERTK